MLHHTFFIPLLFILLLSPLPSHSQKKPDSTFHNYQVNFTFPKDTTWEIGVIELDPYYTMDSSQKIHPIKITVFPENANIHAFLTIERCLSILTTDFDDFVDKIVGSYIGIEIISTKRFKHQGKEALEITCKWKEMGAKYYSYQRNWYIVTNTGFISAISFEGDEKTYKKYFKQMEKIMKSVVFD